MKIYFWIGANFEKFNTDSLKHLNHAFDNCTALEKINFTSKQISNFLDFFEWKSNSFIWVKVVRKNLLGNLEDTKLSNAHIGAPSPIFSIVLSPSSFNTISNMTNNNARALIHTTIFRPKNSIVSCSLDELANHTKARHPNMIQKTSLAYALQDFNPFLQPDVPPT